MVMAVKSCAATHSASLVNEKEILDEFKDCPEIIQCYGDSHSFEHGENLYNLFLEYASGGALADKLKVSGDRILPECEVQRYTKGILKGLDCIHKNGFVHCDIKLQNILVTGEGAVKIADFGLAKRVGEEKERSLGCELRGTPMYMSPEMVTGGDQSAAADVWALGCLVAEMVSGAPVWSFSGDIAALLMRIGVGEEVPEVPAKLSDDGKDFLNKCFVKNPELRWTAEMLLRHPFVTSLDRKDDTVTSPKGEGEGPSCSPRTAFDFPDWVSSTTFSITSLTSSPASSPAPAYQSWFPEQDEVDSAAERLRGLFSDQQQQVDRFGSGDWIDIR